MAVYLSFIVQRVYLWESCGGGLMGSLMFQKNGYTVYNLDNHNNNHCLWCRNSTQNAWMAYSSIHTTLRITSATSLTTALTACSSNSIVPPSLARNLFIKTLVARQ